MGKQQNCSDEVDGEHRDRAHWNESFNTRQRPAGEQPAIATTLNWNAPTASASRRCCRVGAR
jgi:hypothetical protein